EQLRRSAKDRSEQAIVARAIQRTLARRAVWVTAPAEPVVVRMANIQHLATPIRAQLAEPVGAVDLAGLLHPTPAVGGEPRGPADAEARADVSVGAGPRRVPLRAAAALRRRLHGPLHRVR